MAGFLLSRRARADLIEIGTYSSKRWGAVQAESYLRQLHAVMGRLADSLILGRASETIRPGLLRANAGSHMIFFRREPAGILVCRVLHQRMLAERQPIEDGDRD